MQNNNSNNNNNNFRGVVDNKYTLAINIARGIS
jgi:hypothetical protein